SGGSGGSGGSGARDGGAKDAPAGKLDGGTDTGNPGAGGNSVMGTVMGKPVNSVSTALWRGKPDFPAANTLVFLFEKPITGAEIGMPGWDIPANRAGNQVLELKMGLPTVGGTVPMTFTVRPPTPMGMAA